MKKLVSIVFVLIFLLGLMGCNTKEKIPSISKVSQMMYSEVNGTLSGKDIQEIRDAWGEPVESDGKEDVWQLDESMLLFISYNDSGIIESCELVCGTPLEPASSVEAEATVEMLEIIESIETTEVETETETIANEQPSVDNAITEPIFIRMENPSWKRYTAEEKLSGTRPFAIKLLEESTNNITDTDVWFEKNNLQ